jgi:hypothetical protein
MKSISVPFVIAAAVLLTLPAPATSVPPASSQDSVAWKAGDSVLGRWTVANTYQCGTPVANGTSFTFNLTYAPDGSCGRNQMLPMGTNGEIFQLQEGRTYTWTFHYIDGKPDGSGPGMGDSGVPDSLIWQVHPYSGPSGTLGVRLNFIDGRDGVSKPQMWGFYAPQSEGTLLWWTGSYTPGEQDDFKIVLAPLSSTSTGVTKLYRNGVLQFTKSGANYVSPSTTGGQPWWNFGPYKWRWELANAGGSSTTEVNATITDMTLSVR